MKITLLTGAGLSTAFAGLSTWKITNNLRILNVPDLEIDGILPGEYFYRKLCLHYTGRRKNDCDLATVNFETIIHLLEEMYAYLSSYIKGDKKIRAEYKGIKPAFLKLQETISKDLYEVKFESKKVGLYQLIQNYYTYFIASIVNELKDFDTKASNGMKQFNERFLVANFPDSDWIKRIYTLNYDNWFNLFEKYYDGFDVAGNFESGEVMNNDKPNCYFNLHGCVYWQNTLDQNKITKQKKVVDFHSYFTSSAFGINREPLLSTPIITGYNKLQRMKYNPYLQFYYSMQKDILNSDILVIIGYSFTDPHINNLLELFKKKTVIVDYIADWMKTEEDMRKFLNNSKKLKAYEKKYGTIDPTDIGYEVFSEKVIGKFRNVSPFNGGFELDIQDISKGWVSSRNNLTKFWWRGIGEEFYNKWPQIIA